MINLLRALMSKVDTMQGQMDIVSQKLKTRRKKQKEMLEIKNAAKETKECL